MKRLMALLLMLCIALTGMALAEDELYEEVDDSEFNEDAVVPVVGAVYPDKVLSDFDSNSPALYTARTLFYTEPAKRQTLELIDSLPFHFSALSAISTSLFLCVHFQVRSLSDFLQA